jgi:hypothetical protein
MGLKLLEIMMAGLLAIMMAAGLLLCPLALGLLLLSAGGWVT